MLNQRKRQLRFKKINKLLLKSRRQKGLKNWKKYYLISKKLIGNIT